jgi:hypothetical protein
MRSALGEGVVMVPHCIAGSIALILSFTVSAQVQTARSIPEDLEHVEISVLESDSSGETRFSTALLEWNYWFRQGKTTAGLPVRELAFYQLSNGLDMGFHKAPQRQFLTILQGTLQIEASNGDIRQFHPGSIFLVTDVEMTSRGHKTKVVGDVDVFTLVTTIPGDVNFVELLHAK